MKRPAGAGQYASFSLFAGRRKVLARTFPSTVG